MYIKVERGMRERVDEMRGEGRGERGEGREVRGEEREVRGKG